MLILSRKLDEQIVIGGGIIITVVSIRGGKVRIGIEAPPNVSIQRQEMLEPRAGAMDADSEPHGPDARPAADSRG